jgi:hypothetical protein
MPVSDLSFAVVVDDGCEIQSSNWPALLAGNPL